MADAAGIFSECAIAFVPSASLPPKLISSVRALLVVRDYKSPSHLTRDLYSSKPF